MSTVREVRGDQHGTTTGYAYGCRCEECAAARRAYQRSHLRDYGEPLHGYVRPSAETMERVYVALEHEADMDGLVTATGDRLGELTGLSGHHARSAVHYLSEAGRIEIVGRVGVGGVLEIQLPEAS